VEPKSLISQAFEDGPEFLHTRTKHGLCKNSPRNRECRMIRPFTLLKNGKSRAKILKIDKINKFFLVRS
jgi:hypothetical protein